LEENKKLNKREKRNEKIKKRINKGKMENYIANT
jgi:hypothetical protein